MPIIKVKNKRETADDNQLAGAFLPPQVNQYVILYTLAVGISKSVLIRELIEAWMKVQKPKEPERELVKKIYRKIQVQWKVERSIHYEADFDGYVEALKKELKAKGVNSEYIEKIVNGIKDATF